MIEIISGVYGAHDGLKRAGDAPFYLSAEEEKRLVERGVARYIYAPAPNVLPTPVATPPIGGDGGNESDNTPDSDNGAGGDGSATDGDDLGDEEDSNQHPTFPAYSVDMKVERLRALMEQFKLPFKVGMTKGDMVLALDDYFTNTQDDGDTPPELGAEEPVL